MRNVTYLGVTEPSFSNNAFYRCTSLTCVTVTPYYSSNTFCNISTCAFSSLSSSSESLSHRSDSSSDNQSSLSSSSSESLTSHSESNGDISIIDGFVVKVIVEGAKANEINMNEFKQAVSILTNITEASLGIKTTVDDKGNIIAIFVTVKDEETANIISDALNQFSKECPNISQVGDEMITCDGVLKYVKSATVVSKTIELSYSCSPNLYQLTSMMMVWMLILLLISGLN